MNDSSIPIMSQFSWQTREAVRQYQQQSLRELLHYAWKHSSFYRDYYGSDGIKEKDLPDVTIRDLPFLSKQILMENFDRAVTDPWLKKKEVEEWIYSHPDPSENYRGDFIVVNSSGSSGNIGIFVYDQKAWQVVNSTVASHLPMPVNYPSGKTRAAFYIVSHGHYSGVSTAVRMPKDIYDILILSLFDHAESIVEKLNAFQPHQLHGYSSSVVKLAELAIQGKLHIYPQRIFVGADKLTASMEGVIREAWRASIYVLYSASESKFLAFKEARQDDMTILDDLNIVEILDDNNGAVCSGGEGRVVLTNLYNYTLPILRYDLGDYAVVGTGQPDSPFRTIRDIQGRVNDALPVVLHDGSCDSIGPHLLEGFHVPGLEKIQFISERPDHVQIDYIAAHDADAAVREKFQHILAMKGASRTTFEVRRVQHIPNDLQTGKLRLVKTEHAQMRYPSQPIADVRLEQGIHAGRLGPTNPFVEFKKEEVEQSIPARFEQRVVKYADRIAVKTRNHTLTYGALNKMANRLANTILTHRGEKEEPIALFLEHDAPMIAVILAVLKAGKICVPLDPSYPEARASCILGDSQAKLIVTNSKNLPVARMFAQPRQQLIIDIDEIDANLSVENLGLSISPDALAFILYTSGSTGQPKGVVQNHRNVIHNAMRYGNGCRISAEDRVTLLASLGTGQATPTAFSALLSGATLYPYNIREEGVAGLSSWLNTEEITVYISAPTLFRQFVGTLTGDEKFPKLRMIRLGAEQVEKRDVELYKKHFSAHCTFAIFLSATEVGNLCQYFVDKETEIASDIVPVGYAVNGVEILLLNDAGKEVGFNEIGEIAVKSCYVSPGYWRRPDLTQAAFLPDPKGGDERIYRTGDLGRMRPDGCLEHLGRKDSQVKVSGYRIEIAEVETALLALDAIKEAVVVAREDRSGDQQLVAYLVPKKQPGPTVTTFQRVLRGRLPDYMIPSAFVLLDALPLTPTGKVDRRALPARLPTRPELDTPFVSPRTPLEEALAGIWAEILGLDQVGIHDNFLDLGGNSLRAIQVIPKVLNTFKVEVPLRTLLEASTVADMAVVIRQNQAEKAGQEALARMLADVEACSDEEAQHLLEQELRGKKYKRSSPDTLSANPTRINRQ